LPLPLDKTVQKNYTGHNPALTPRYDVAKAKALMKAAGYEKGFGIKMIAPNNRYVNDEKIAQAVAAMLKKINISVSLITFPKAQYFHEIDQCAGDLLMMGWTSDTGDSANYSQYLTMTRDKNTGKGAYNCGYYSNAQLNDLIERAVTELDADKRTAMLKKASRIEYDDAAFIALHWEKFSWGYNKKVSNLQDIIKLRNFPHFEQLLIK